MPSSSEQKWLSRKTSLTENLISFSRFLRTKGFSIGPIEESDALTALSLISTYDEEQFKDVLQSIYVKNRKQHLTFEKHFLEFWKELEKASDAKTKKSNEAIKSGNKQPSLKSLKDWLYGKDSQKNEKSLASYSSLDILTEKDFSVYTDDEIEEIQKILNSTRHNLSNKKRRRFTSTRKHSIVDLRKSIRKNIRSGSDLINLQFKTRDKEKTQIVLLCDVSKSMDLYSGFLIQFIFAFQTSYRSIETFVFSSRLERITKMIKDQEFKDAMKILGDSVHNWSGGTRIGQSLEDFIIKYPTLLNNHTIVIILSDGWDTGNLDTLENSLKWMKRKSKKIVWLNPLLSNPNFKPETAGMKSALPYIDELRPCHNTQSLKDLIRTLR